MIKGQKEKIEKYAELVTNECFKGDAGMYKYFKNNTAYVVELSNGDLIDIEKPRIRTKFCFGYSSIGQGASFDEAIACKEYASKEVSYFMEENLEPLNDWIVALKENECYIANHYYNSPEDTKIKGLVCFRYSDYEQMSEERKTQYRKLTEDDKLRLIEGYEQVFADFVKRLQSYLKRYGLTKLETWTYWIDE